MTTRSSRLIILWLAVAATTIALPAGFVAAVDPFGYFGTNTLGYYHSSERQFKRSLARGGDYNALILGDSRIAFTDPSYINLPQYRFLNAGIGASRLSEQLTVLLNSRLDKLDLVVMGLNFNSLSRDCPVDPAAELSWWDSIRFSAAWTQLWYAATTLRLKAKGAPPEYHRDGTRDVTSKNAVEAALSGKNARYWNALQRDSENLQELFENRPFGMNLAEACVRALAHVQALADRHGFRLLLVFVPVNRDLLIRVDWKSWHTSEQSRRSFRRLLDITPNVVDFLDSPYSDSGNFWLHDSRHFKPEIGARLIEEAIRMTVHKEPLQATSQPVP